MKYFVSWTNREPLFQEYDSNCNILISPTNLPLDWSISKWSNLPKELFVDSGAYSYRDHKIPSCEDVLNRQIHISKAWPTKTSLYFSHPDLLIPLNADFEKYNCIVNESINRAKNYLHTFKKRKIFATPIGVIHGLDEETIACTYYRLQKMGYRSFALGSLSNRITTNRRLIIKVLEIIKNYNIKPIHIFGINLPIELMKEYYTIRSFDTSAATKLALYGTVLYGSPLKRYIINPNSYHKYHAKCFSFTRLLEKPKKCSCIVCNEDPTILGCHNSGRGKLGRIIHNYFQIKWELKKIISVGPGR